MKYDSKFYTIPVILLMSSSLLYVYAAFSGIVYVDDGYYLISAKYPQDILINFNLSYKLTSFLYSLSGQNVGIFRLMTIILNALSVLILTYVLNKFIFANKLVHDNDSQKSIFIHYFVLLYLASGIVYMHGMTLDYNIPPRILAIIQASIILWLFIEKNKINYFSLLMLGLVTGVDILLRPPAFLCSFFIILFVLGVLYKHQRYKILFFIVGILLFIILYFGLVQNYTEFFNILLPGIKYAAGENHTYHLLVNNLQDIINSLLDSVFFIFIYVFWERYSFLPLLSNYKLFVIILIVLSVASIRFVGGGGDGDFTTIIAVINRAFFDMLILILFENYRKNGQSSFKSLFNYIGFVSVVLLGLAYAVSIGTATPIFYHIAFSESIIFAVIIIQVTILLKDNCKTLIKTLQFLSIFVFLVQVVGIIFYNANYNCLFEQKIPYKIDRGYIFLDRYTLDDINLLKNAFQKCDFKEGSYIVGFYGLPSMIYLAGGRAAVTPWHFNVTPEWNQYVVNKMADVEGKQIFLLVDKNRFNELDNSKLLELFVPCAEFTFNGKSKFPVGKYVVYYEANN